MTSASRSIGLFLPLSETHSQRVFQGVIEYAAEHPGIVLRDFFFSKRWDSDEHVRPGSVPPWTGQVDGVVTFVPRVAKVIEWVERGGVPAISVSADTLGTSLPSVAADIGSHVCLAIDHLTELGYGNFAYYAHSQFYGSQLRHDRLALELSRRKLKLQVIEFAEPDLDPDKIFPDLLNQQNGPLQKLLRTAAKPLAVVALGPPLALVACLVAGQLGLRIPEDVAVLSFHDTDILRASSPPVTAIRIPSEQIGYEAARLLHRMIEGKRLARREVTIPNRELIIRESTVGRQRNIRTDIDRAVKLIHARACEGILLEEIASELHMSLRTFELQFAAATGHTVGEEIRRVRLDRAKELLRTTELSFTRIAMLVGFGTGSCLTRFFRQHTGLTPSEFRARGGSLKKSSLRS